MRRVRHRVVEDARAGRPLRSRAIAAVGAVALTAASWAGGTSASTASATDRPGVAPPLRIGTYNIQIGRDLVDFRAAVHKLRPHVDVAGLQEIAGRGRNPWLDEHPAWQVYRPPSLEQVPVIWDPKDFAFVSGRQSRLAVARRVEDKHGGTMMKKTTYAAVVRLRQRATGQRIAVINVHLLSHSTRRGLPNPDAPLRHEYYVEQMNSLQQLADAENAAGFRAFVTGDFNISYAADEREQRRRHPYRRFGDIGMTSMWQGRTLAAHGTHIDTDCRPGVLECGAYIDGVWASGRPTGASVLTEVVHSDHYPAVATYDLR